MPGEIDLRSRIVTRAFQHLYPTFSKLGVEHIDTDFDAVSRCIALQRDGRVGKSLYIAVRPPFWDEKTLLAQSLRAPAAPESVASFHGLLRPRPDEKP